MAYSVQKSRLAKVAGVSLVLLLAACSSDSRYKRQVSGDEAYLQASPLSELHAPAGMILPIQVGDYNIPVANSTGAVGKALDIRPPAQPLALVSGARTQFNGDTATLMVENGRSGSLWAQVTSILQAKNYVIAKRDDASQTLNTDWVEWNRLDEDQQYRGRYQISVKPQGYQQAVVVKLVNLEQAGKPVADPASLQRYSTAMLNVISEGLDMNATSAQNAAQRSAGATFDVQSRQHQQGTLWNLAPPTQGLVSLAILGITDRLKMADADDAQTVHRIVEATKRAFALRDAHITDPRHLDVDVQQLLTPEALQPLADSIDDASASPWGGGKGPGDTVWMGVVDNSGLAVSFIQSIYHEFGSGVVLPDTGIVWQNRGAAFSLDPQHLLALAPGKQPFHTLNPAAARLNDGRVMVYGSMGGDGQPQTQAALFTRYILQGVPLQESISRPRWLLGRTWGQSSDSLKLEGRFAPACIARLRELGHDVEVLADFSEAMGHAGAIVRHPNGLLEGATDPRSNGAAAGY